MNYILMTFMDIFLIIYILFNLFNMSYVKHSQLILYRYSLYFIVVSIKAINKNCAISF
jgi:hypothetical protein